ncbi:hypothetical protein JXA84_05350 [candidate division WOR-3 bacterium]|nr:hypothetical protein [candidate division WOR-3 bacterium]
MFLRFFKNRILWVVGGILFAAVFALLGGLFVKILWNWLMPCLFSLPRISYWQAWGLVILSQILFKQTEHHFGSNSREDRHRKIRDKLRDKFPENFEQS